ncbi:ATP-binding protein [Streptomyces fuscigenes]|uniref:ATP-binding protein n=1 Tax=Streptomyces fuscigenes TaxID=1528880 RepID=UPI001F3E68D2|nr:ATP-binding protein [Streptomyces fuscigenes]MCF3963736.1 ATP-binding protein [Streptomyces fuscigenes]
MSSISVAAVLLGVATLVLVVVSLRLARSRRQQARRARELAQAAQAADARALAAEARTRSAEARVQAAQAQGGEFREELDHLVSRRLPALALNLISDHHPVPGPLHAEGAAAPGATAGDGPRDAADGAAAATDPFAPVLDLFRTTVLKERRRIDAAARAALRGASQDMQALSYRLQTEIDALQHEFSAPRSLTRRLLAADHLNEQNLRLIQKAAIVCGAWPGHVRKDTYAAEVVTGASSRLRGFDRVKISSRMHASNIAIVGRAAEPVAVAVAELMANALEHSRDDLLVDVSLIQTENGSVCVTVDDAGKGMTGEAVARGKRLVSGADQQNVMLTELGDPPSQGFAAIGRLVADYGFHVSIDNPSPYGGVRAVLSIPPNLLTSIDEEAEPLSAMAPLPAVPPQVPKRPAPTAPAAPSAPAPVPTAAAVAPELPQRRRREPARAVEAEAAAPTTRDLDPERVRDTWSQFEEGLASGRAHNDPEETL